MLARTLRSLQEIPHGTLTWLQHDGDWALCEGTLRVPSQRLTPRKEVDVTLLELPGASGGGQGAPITPKAIRDNAENLSRPQPLHRRHAPLRSGRLKDMPLDDSSDAPPLSSCNTLLLAAGLPPPPWVRGRT